jgi:hypothetical protein
LHEWLQGRDEFEGWEVYDASDLPDHVTASWPYAPSDDRPVKLVAWAHWQPTGKDADAEAQAHVCVEVEFDEPRAPTADEVLAALDGAWAKLALAPLVAT